MTDDDKLDSVCMTELIIKWMFETELSVHHMFLFKQRTDGKHRNKIINDLSVILLLTG